MLFERKTGKKILAHTFRTNKNRYTWKNVELKRQNSDYIFDDMTGAFVWILSFWRARVSMWFWFVSVASLILKWLSSRILYVYESAQREKATNWMKLVCSAMNSFCFVLFLFFGEVCNVRQNIELNWWRDRINVEWFGFFTPQPLHLFRVFS